MVRWVCFNHGKESGPWGTKIARLATVAEDHGYQVMSPDYRGMDDVNDRIAALRAALPDTCDRLVLMGSSMGAYVAAAVASERPPDGLFLLAPAVLMPGYEGDLLQPRAGVSLAIHGWHDEIVPVDNALRFCRHHDLSLLLLDSDHRLMSALDIICQQFALLLQQLEKPCCN
jgi:alpha/beta superfamily hydrolase